MATLKETLVSILQTDAQLTGGGQLGDLLGKSAASPYGIYYQNPPEEFDDSVITYFVSVMTDQRPRQLFLNITAWGDNFEAILNRVETLISTQAGLTVSPFKDVTDYTMNYFEWNSALPELWDDSIKVYHQTARYLAKGWKT